MNKTPGLLHQKLLWPMLAMLVAPGLSTAGTFGRDALAQGAGVPTGPPAVSPASPTAPPEIVKPVLPRELDNPDTVFRNLDTAKRGYVTLDDTRDLIGFGDAFRKVDTKGSGQLTQPEFSKAWSIYKARK